MYRQCLSLIAVLLLSCSLFTGYTLAMPKASAPANSPAISGKVLETMDASGYTYMLVESGTQKSWIAIPATSVKEGSTVKYYEGMEMENFTSKTLDRTFESIVFSPGLADQEGQQASAPKIVAAEDSFSAAVKAEKKVPETQAPMTVSAGSAGSVVPLEELTIEKAAGANGYTVGEIFEKAKDLAGKKVQVRGKVVKFSPMIMGKNWIHLQDGTGNPMKNSHDLVVTTGETVEIGEVVTIEGLLAAEKDFGAGYKYNAIIEESFLVK